MNICLKKQLSRLDTGEPWCSVVWGWGRVRVGVLTLQGARTYQWRIQDFPDGATNPCVWAKNLLLGKIFAKNCMKLKETRGKTRRRRVLSAPWTCQNSSVLTFIIFNHFSAVTTGTWSVGGQSLLPRGWGSNSTLSTSGWTVTATRIISSSMMVRLHLHWANATFSIELLLCGKGIKGAWGPQVTNFKYLTCEQTDRQTYRHDFKQLLPQGRWQTVKRTLDFLTADLKATSYSLVCSINAPY